MFTDLSVLLLCDVSEDVAVVTVVVGVGRGVVVDVLVSDDKGIWGLRIDVSIRVDGEDPCCAELILVAGFPSPSLAGPVDSS